MLLMNMGIGNAEVLLMVQTIFSSVPLSTSPIGLLRLDLMQMTCKAWQQDMTKANRIIQSVSVLFVQSRIFDPKSSIVMSVIATNFNQ